MPFTEDFSEFTDTADFGTAATYTGTETSTVNGIFMRGYEPVGDGEIAIASDAPVFACAAADLDDDPIGYTLTINGLIYTIRNVEPDTTTNWTRCILEQTG